MTREQLECFVEAAERLVKSDLVGVAGAWRQEIEELKMAYKNVKEQGIPWKGAADAAPGRSAWVSPDRRLLFFHLPLDLTCLFLEAAKGVLQGEVESDRAFGLLRAPGRPVDPHKSKNLDIAEKAFMQRLQGKTWVEINNEIFADKAEPPDERFIRTIVTRYQPVIMQKWREDLRQRWLECSEARGKEIIERNKRKGKADP